MLQHVDVLVVDVVNSLVIDFGNATLTLHSKRRSLLANQIDLFIDLVMVAFTVESVIYSVLDHLRVHHVRGRRIVLGSKEIHLG